MKRKMGKEGKKEKEKKNEEKKRETKAYISQ
jgi:hypothetical protein